jgi:nicotinamidase/pyrazinamidase
MQSFKTAFIQVDPQVDFGNVGGALYVPGGEEIIDELNTLRIALDKARVLQCVILTQDSHPIDHISFHVNNPGSVLFKEYTLSSGIKQMMWPVHCQIGTLGHEFLPGLLQDVTDIVVQKGTNKNVDSYSGFGSEDFVSEITSLDRNLRSLDIKYVVIGGLAFDYCVSATAKDAARLGYFTIVVRSATRGISPESCEREENLMRASGVIIVENAEDAVKLIINNM